ncbi:MAG: sigma-70 family RNA polymerase sigma factor [Cyclobacteriaceae bacterium]|nr:sigma-70 family RNA polymerase sigma factor [Cyclobacteriaceae bacterium]
MNLTIKKSITLESLVEQCRKQDGRAQRMLYERLSPKMLGVCRRYIGDTLEAEGVLVNGFLKVFNKINQFSGSGNFEGWVRRIMVNESLLYLRKNKSMYLEVDIDEAHTEPDYGRAAYLFEERELIEMIDKLPMGYRTVFNLYAIEGFSHKEISEQLGINENTSKSQLSRARALLKNEVLRREQLVEQNMAGNEKSKRRN